LLGPKFSSINPSYSSNSQQRVEEKWWSISPMSMVVVVVNVDCQSMVNGQQRAVPP
jgi:hypothetical protein